MPSGAQAGVADLVVDDVVSGHVMVPTMSRPRCLGCRGTPRFTRHESGTGGQKGPQSILLNTAGCEMPMMEQCPQQQPECLERLEIEGVTKDTASQLAKSFTDW